MNKNFNKEELTIMSFYNLNDRESLINDLKNVLPYIVEYDVEIEVEDILKKLKDMTNKDFEKINFKDIIEVESEL